jgi:hypothetical protein
MQTRKAEIQNPWTVIFIVAATLLWVLVPAQLATADSADSAHRSNSYGVDRAGAGYTTGDCAHCHETFDPLVCGLNNFLLFYDDWVGICDLFCFKCHSDATDVQQVDNNPYCVNFGGLSPAYNTNIKQQFCDPGSTYYYPEGARHDLVYIRNFIADDANGWGFGSDPNPCVACHNPHYDQRNHPVVVTGTLNTAIRRPSHYKSSNAEDKLWGDDEDERMDVYAATFTDGVYQPPYFGDTTSGKFEPTGTTTNYAGDRTPDYPTFCLDCHQYTLDSQYGEGEIRAIKTEWETGTHGYGRHGGAGRIYGTEPLKPPYTDLSKNYVLSCLDCHQPHGDGRDWASGSDRLLRRMINGLEWERVPMGWCDACHIQGGGY